MNRQQLDTLLRETIAHIAWAEKFYFETIVAALVAARQTQDAPDDES